MKYKLQNPIIYFFLLDMEKDENFIESVKSKQNGFNEATAYIEINDSTSITELLQTYHKEFIKYQYKTRGVVRINYVVSACTEKIEMLKNIISELEDSISKLYLGGIIEDIYVILKEDLQIDREDNFFEAFNLLDDIKNKVNMIYVLSNINSNGTTLETQNYISSLSTASLIKNCVTSGTTESFYNERYFCEDGKRVGADFFTIGHFSLRVPIEKIEKIAIHTACKLLLLKKADEVEIFEAFFRYKTSNLDETEENIIGIAINNNFKNIKTNSDAIYQIFENRLDIYFEINKNEYFYDDEIIDEQKLVSEILDYANMNEISEIEMYNTFSESGYILNELKNNILDFKSQISDLEQKFKIWLAEPVKIKLQTNLFNFAAQYVNWLIKIEKQKVALDNCIALQNISRIILNKTKESYESLLCETKRLENEILLDTESLKLKDYYSKMTTILFNTENKINHNNDIINTIKSEISEKLINNIKSMTFEDELFQRLYEIEFLNEKAVAKLILDQIIDNKIYNINLKLNDENKHTEIIIIVNEKSIVAKYIKEAKYKINEDKISVHFVKDKKDIEVLYQMGTFKIGELYYEQLYR